MYNLLRKQLYLEPSQDQRVKRWAKIKGVSEAEIIRRALTLGLDAFAMERSQEPKAPRERFFARIEALIKAGSIPGGRMWKREDLYDDA